MKKMSGTIEITTQLLQNHIRNTLDKLCPLLNLANAPMVKFFNENLWKTHVPNEIQQEIQTTADINEAVEIYWKQLDIEENNIEVNDKFKHFRAFLNSTKQYHLDSFQDVWITPEKLNEIFDNQRNTPLAIKGFMSTKKNHEV